MSAPPAGPERPAAEEGAAAARRGRRAAFRLPRRGSLAALALLGPGLISAMAGDDAGGIATYASVGAEYGYALLWALVLITVSLAIVQEMASRMGAVTGKGFADLVREELGVRVAAVVMSVLVVANAGLVVSEFVGVGAAGELFGVPRWLLVPPMAVLVWTLVVKGSYERVERVFLLLTLTFLAYPVSAFLARPDWAEVGRQVVRPTVHLTPEYLTLFIAMVGTTITPYMQLYAQSATAEKPGVSLRLAKVDAYLGAVVSDLVAAFIIIATGATLFVAGQRVETASDAAAALGPLVGPYAPYVFGAGLFGASMLAAGVLPLATAYAVTEAFGFEKGVSRGFREAPVFNGLFTGLIVLGAAVALLPGINVIRLLVATQVLNGVLLPIVLAAILRLVNDREVMGEHVNGRVYNVVAWATVVLVATLSTVYLTLTVLGWFGLGPGA